MIQTVQLSISDEAYQAAVRSALCRNCAWHVVSSAVPDASKECVLVVDELAFFRLPLPVPNPERVVLITRGDSHETMSQAWEAGIVSVVSADDPVSTVLLAIMAAALRVAKPHTTGGASGISPNPESTPAPISAENQTLGSKRCKTP
jgi:hypothetical protein